MLKLTVNASKKYDITIDSSFESLHDSFNLEGVNKVALITDDNVNRLYGNSLDDFLSDKEVCKIVIEAGEESKNAENYFKILEKLAEEGFLRNDCVIALGGGVVGDLSGFVASTYMRGIKLFMIPTTLLSAVDSSVGGKTAINLKTGKNLCGSFYQPNGVFVNLSFLKSLPEREIKSGMGEVVKYSFLGDLAFEDIKDGITENLVYKCLAIKRDIVENDEKENGKRKLLNLGHTVGHAVERLSGFSLSHGECVAKGLKAALDVSKKLYNLSDLSYEQAIKTIKCSKTDVSIGYSVDEIVDLIKVDKKTQGCCVDFITIGEDLVARIEKISLADLREALVDER